MGRFLDSVAGFGVTFSAMFRKPNTEFYPEQRKQAPDGFHGRHVLNRYPDGLEKCIGCELCAWACPADAIHVEGAENTDAQRYSPGERYGRRYEIDYLRCIFCGLCVEACPTRALTMSTEFELAGLGREQLLFTKEQLLAELGPGMAAPPHPMAPGTEPADYYAGRVPAPPSSLTGASGVLRDTRTRSAPASEAPPSSLTGASGVLRDTRTRSAPASEAPPSSLTGAS